MDNIIENGDIQNETKVNSEYILTKALNFKKMWNKMDEENKDIMWKYFNSLINLCEKYVNEVINN